MSKETTKFAPLNSQKGQDKLKSFKIDENLNNIENINQADVKFRDLGAAGAKKDKDTSKENRRMEIIRSFIEKIKEDRIRNLESICQETALSPEHKNEAIELKKKLLDKERSYITSKEIKDNLVIKNISEQEEQQIDVSIVWANKQIDTKIDEKVALIDKLLEGITIENPPNTEDVKEQAGTTNAAKENTASHPEELDISSLGVEVDTSESENTKPDKTTKEDPKKDKTKAQGAKPEEPEEIEYGSEGEVISKKGKTEAKKTEKKELPEEERIKIVNDPIALWFLEIDPKIDPQMLDIKYVVTFKGALVDEKNSRRIGESTVSFSNYEDYKKFLESNPQTTYTNIYWNTIQKDRVVKNDFISYFEEMEAIKASKGIEFNKDFNRMLRATLLGEVSVERKDSSKSIETEDESRPAETKKFPEVLTEEQLKRKETLDKMQAEVSEARKEYLEMYHKKKSAYNRLKKFFGSLTSRSDYDRLGEEDQDVAYCYNLYKSKLTEYRSLRLTEEKEEGDSGKEVGERYKLMELEENLSLAETRMELRIASYEGKFSQFVKECNNDLTEKWKKLHWAKKVGIGYAVYIPGALAIGAGPAMLVGIGGVLIKKIIEVSVLKKIDHKKKEKIDQYIDSQPKIIDFDQGANMSTTIQGIDKRLSELNKEIPTTKDNEKQDKLRNEKMQLETMKDNFRYITNVASFRSFLAGSNRKEWLEISKKPVVELIDTTKRSTTSRDGKNIESRFFMIYNNLKNNDSFKDKLMPISDKETLDEWVRRMARIAYETKTSNI